MRLLLAPNNQATRRNEIIKATFNWIQAATGTLLPKTKPQLPPTDPMLGPENFLKTGSAFRIFSFRSEARS